jgi:hypothetical protein
MEQEPEDWQIVVIATTFYDEVDCNSGRHLRVWLASGKIEYLD